METARRGASEPRNGQEEPTRGRPPRVRTDAKVHVWIRRRKRLLVDGIGNRHFAQRAHVGGHGGRASGGRYRAEALLELGDGEDDCDIEIAGSGAAQRRTDEVDGSAGMIGDGLRPGAPPQERLPMLGNLALLAP
jgi:hypothetical protein